MQWRSMSLLLLLHFLSSADFVAEVFGGFPDVDQLATEEETWSSSVFSALFSIFDVEKVQFVRNLSFFSKSLSIRLPDKSVRLVVDVLCVNGDCSASASLPHFYSRRVIHMEGLHRSPISPALGLPETHIFLEALMFDDAGILLS